MANKYILLCGVVSGDYLSPRVEFRPRLSDEHTDIVTPYAQGAILKFMGSSVVSVSVRVGDNYHKSICDGSIRAQVAQAAAMMSQALRLAGAEAEVFPAPM